MDSYCNVCKDSFGASRCNYNKFLAAFARPRVMSNRIFDVIKFFLLLFIFHFQILNCRVALWTQLDNVWAFVDESVVIVFFELMEDCYFAFFVQRKNFLGPVCRKPHESPA